MGYDGQGLPMLPGNDPQTITMNGPQNKARNRISLDLVHQQSQPSTHINNAFSPRNEMAENGASDGLLG
jgi:hypothetical protein